MDLTGLLNSITLAVDNIDKGRRFFVTDGLEHAGRIAYEDGISIALDTLKKASNHGFAVSADPQTMILVEMTYLQQELHFCNEAEATYPTSPKYRYHGFPRDAVHLACDAHRTRLKNTLRSPGINMIEKAVLAQRISNMTTIKAAYSEKQRTALKS